MDKIAVILTDGFEETEAIGTIDVLRRAISFSNNKLKEIVTFSLDSNKLMVNGAHNIQISADDVINNLKSDEYSAIVLPGGPGHINYFKSEILKKITLKMYEDNKIIAAICAAPQYLGFLELVKDKKVVFYPGCDQHLNTSIKVFDQSVIQSENIITGTSISSAIDFGLLIASNYLENGKLELLKESLVKR